MASACSTTLRGNVTRLVAGSALSPIPPRRWSACASSIRTPVVSRTVSASSTIRPGSTARARAGWDRHGFSRDRSTQPGAPCGPAGYHPVMDPAVRDAFLASFSRCRASEGFLEELHRRFVASSEEVRAKFVGTDMKQQVPRALEDSLYVIANAIQGQEGSIARDELPRIAARHSRSDRDIRPDALRPVARVPDRGRARPPPTVLGRARVRLARDARLRHRLHAGALLAAGTAGQIAKDLPGGVGAGAAGDAAAGVRRRRCTGTGRGTGVR